MTVLLQLFGQNISRSCTQPLVKLSFKGFVVFKLCTDITLMHLYHKQESWFDPGTKSDRAVQRLLSSCLLFGRMDLSY